MRRCFCERGAECFFTLASLLAAYEICADEAWTHHSLPLNRYWCFFGGLLGELHHQEELESRLCELADARGYRGEIKWQNVSTQTLEIYQDLLDVVFEFIRSGKLRYRQTFLDRRFKYLPKLGDAELSELDVQFRIYYQFLTHAFGLKYLPKLKGGNQHQILVRLDRHSSQKHIEALTSFVQRIPVKHSRADLTVKVSFVASGKFRRIQICDLMMGAAGSYGNKMQKRRREGVRGMSSKQKLRLKMAKHVYNGLRKIDEESRGKKAFNWFESTGKDGVGRNVLDHPMRIWKFVPNTYQVDDGWANDHLDRHGQYQGPDILDEIHDRTVASEFR